MIYFVLCRQSNLVKIGYTKDVSSRFRALQRMCPVDLELLGCIQGNGEMERKFHTHFFMLHARDEWFHYTARLPQSITALLSGTFNMGALPDRAHRSWALAWRASDKPVLSNGRLRKLSVVPDPTIESAA